MSFRRRSCRSSALGGTVAACVASCRVFLSLSARSSGGVKMSLVGLISGLFPSIVVSACRFDARMGWPSPILARVRGGAFTSTLLPDFLIVSTKCFNVI